MVLIKTTTEFFILPCYFGGSQIAWHRVYFDIDRFLMMSN